MADLLTSISKFSLSQKNSLKKGGLDTILDLLLLSPPEIAKKCKVSVLEAQCFLDIVSDERYEAPRLLEHVEYEGNEKFTTGDAILDRALGGGIWTGMIWDLAGESSAGKSQLALQLSLTVQLPASLGGLYGSAIYVTTSSWLQTTRLSELIKFHPLLSPSACDMSDIHTQSTATIPKLLYVLTQVLPQFMEDHSRKPNTKPVKLIVIDALAELFRRTDKADKKFMVERSRSLTEISTLLHHLASKYGIAVVVLNEVTDVFNRFPGANMGERGDLLYIDQSRWFNSADSMLGENKKEASLGLVWANQVNARIMLSRTGRRRYLDGATIRAVKQCRAENQSQDLDSASSCQTSLELEEQATLIRRMSVIFNSVSTPTSLDFIITRFGLSALPEDERPRSIVVAVSQPCQETAPPVHGSPHLEPRIQVPPVDVGLVEDGIGLDATDQFDGLEEEDEWDAYWKEDMIPDDAYNSINIDTLEGTNAPSSS